MTESKSSDSNESLTDLVAQLRDEVRQLRKEVAALRASHGNEGPTAARRPDAGAVASGLGGNRGASRAARNVNTAGPNTFEIVFDGGAIGNPGRGYGSFQLRFPEGAAYQETLDHSPNGELITNNQAEYLTLIRALERLLDRVGESAPKSTLTVMSDSQLVVNQVNGLWKVKHPELAPLRQQARDLLEQFGAWTLKWHDRSNSVRLLGH